MLLRGPGTATVPCSTGGEKASMSMFAIGGGGDHVDETLAGVGNKPERMGNFAGQHRQNKDTTSQNIAAAPASCHVLTFLFVESAEMVVLPRWWRVPCPRIGRPLRPTAAALRTRPAVALRTRPVVALRTRSVEALRPATTGLGIAFPGGDVARLPAVAAAVLQGAMAAVVSAAASPVEVAAELFRSILMRSLSLALTA